jgi:hypothetical protein
MYVWVVYDWTMEGALKIVASSFEKAVEVATNIVLDNNVDHLSEDTIKDFLITYYQVDDIVCICKYQLDKEV